MDAAPLTLPAAGPRFDRLAPLPAALLFAARTSLTSLLALYIAFAAGLDRPAWAMVTVFVLSQPISGAVLSKAFYRVVGTLAGATFTLFAIPAFLDMPALLILVLSCWVGLCLYLALRDRSPSAYGFTLSGYTSAIIGFSALDTPLAVFEVAQARVQEIGVGLVCATVTAAVILPQTAQAAAVRRIAVWLKSANAHAAGLLRGAITRKDLARGERDLASGVASLHALMIFLSFEPAVSPALHRNVLGVFARTWLTVQVLAEIRDRLVVLRAGGAIDPGLDALLPRLADFIGGGLHVPAEEGARLAGELRAVAASWNGADGTRGEGGWRQAEQMNLVARLLEMIDLHEDCRTLLLATDAGHPVPEADLRVFAPQVGRALPAIDYTDALRAAAALVLGLWILGAFWILAAWPQGGEAMTMVAIISCVTAAQQDPGAAVGVFLKALLISIAGVFVYQFAILPQVVDFLQLSLVALPALFLVAFMVALPAWSNLGGKVGIMFTATLGLQNVFSSDFVAFANGNLAVLIGAGVVRAMVAVLRPSSGEEAAGRLLRAAWRDIAMLCAAPSGPGRAGIVRRLTDRLALMQPVADPRRTDPAESAFAVAFAAQGVLGLTRGEGAAPAAEGALVRRLLEDVAIHYRALAARSPAPIDGLLATLDDLRGRLAGLAEGREAVVALVSLRRGLLLERPAPSAAAERVMPSTKVERG